MYSEHHRKEKQREADRRYRLLHPDRCRERDRRWREANPDKKAAQNRRHYKRHRAEILDKKRAYYAGVANPRRKVRMCLMTPCEYAEWRARARRRRAIRTVLAGKIYKPRFARRIPSWSVYGRVIDAQSAFLAMNLTASQRAYAMELYRERKERSK